MKKLAFAGDLKKLAFAGDQKKLPRQLIVLSPKSKLPLGLLCSAWRVASM